MAKRVLIPADGLHDAEVAIKALPDVVEPGDEGVILVVLEEPEAELTSGGEPVHPIPEPYTGAAGSTGFRAPNDAPVFVPREELREMKSRDVSEVLDKLTQPLRDRGIGMRVETVFSEDPAAAVLDYAGDMDAGRIMATRSFHERLEADGHERFSSPLPGT